MSSKVTAKRREQLRYYYQQNKDKWLGEGGYMKQNKQYYKPSVLAPVIFEMTHPSGICYIGATRSLKNYLRNAHTRKLVVLPMKEWKITELETADNVSLRDLRERAKVIAKERNATYLGDVKVPDVANERQESDHDVSPSLASTASSLDLREFAAEARRRMTNVDKYQH